MKQKIQSIIKFIIGLAVIATLIFLLPYGCTQPDKATRILNEQGYTEVEITGWRPFMAGENDSFSTGFKSMSPSGARVTGSVTGGWLKGSTIRLD